MIKPGILDGLTSIDELIRENTHTLHDLRGLVEREEERETRIVYFTYPNDGTLATLQAGTTTFDFKVGTIEDVDTVITRMSHSLQSEGRDWLRSFFVNSDKSITVQPDGYDRIPATEEKDALGTYQEFTKLRITCTEETKIFVVCCTSPEAVVRLISNTSVLTDPIDVFGHRTYIGAGELAARLGSINIFEKRGNIIYMDDFESSTLKWLTSGLGTDNTQLRSNANALSNNYSMKLTTGNVEDDYARIRHYMYMPKIKRIGIECAFSLGANLKELSMHSTLYDGTYIHGASIKYLIQTDELQVQTSATGYIAFETSIDLYETDSAFHIWKLTVDFENQKYINAFLDSEKYDISAYVPHKAAVAVTPFLFNQIRVINNSSGNHYAYIDNIILTQNEPL